ncbi:hypothetical protein EWB00_009559, partial [Schistosoma japonicum]
PISTSDTNAPSSTAPDDDDLYIPYIDKLGIRRRRRRLPSDPRVRRNGTAPTTDSGKQPISTSDTNAPSSTAPDDDDLYIPYIDKLGIRRRRRRLPSDPRVRRNGTAPTTDSGKPNTTEDEYYDDNYNETLLNYL